VSNKFAQLCFLCIFILITTSSPGVAAQSEDELNWPIVVDVEFVDNWRYMDNFAISDNATYLYKSGVFADKVWEREYQNYHSFPNLNRNTAFCEGKSAGWSIDNAFLATSSRSFGYGCYGDDDDEERLTAIISLFETDTETVTTTDLTLPELPFEHEPWNSLHWSPFSPTQMVLNGYYLFDIATRQVNVNNVPEAVDLTDLSRYVFYQQGVWDNETQMFVGRISSTWSSVPQLAIYTNSGWKNYQVIFEITDPGEILGVKGNGHWLLWSFGRDESRTSAPTDTEIYLTDVVSGETQLLLRSSDVVDLRGTHGGLTWSPDRNTIAVGLKDDTHREQGFLLITLDWNE
jgi:hypothetical protein